MTQEEYYHKIVERYMQFCAHNAKDLDAAFASLPTVASSDATRNPPAAAPAPPNAGKQSQQRQPSTELSIILLSLRKLREAIVATASSVPIVSSQRVFVFSIRLSILAQHPPSYFPSLKYLLGHLHTSTHPLSEPELREFVSYLILDYACRQNDMVAAFELRARAKSRYAMKMQTVDRVLAALMHDNWVIFWRVRNSVDSYMRAILNWASDRVRRHALKAVGSAYLNADLPWIVQGCTGDKDGWPWEKLVEVEGLGWQKQDNKVIIRIPKRKAVQQSGQSKQDS